MSLVPNDGAVEELASQRADPAFGEGVGDRGADWCLEDLEAFGPEDLVEGVDELGSAVTNKGTSVGEVLRVFEEQIAGLLGAPCAGRFGGDAGKEHFTAGHVDEEQQVVAAQQSCVDGGEVTGHRGLGW